MRLIGWLGTGPITYHLASWRYPTSEMQPPNTKWLRNTARLLEAAKFDAVFFADSSGLHNEMHTRTGGLIELMDPTVVATDIAAHTSDIGIAVTASTTFIPPFTIARSFGTLDYISGGRLAWNIVTSGAQGAREYGVEPMPKADRYKRAAEYVEICQRLWGSLPIEALTVNRETGEFIDTSLVDTFDYEGEYLKAGGPMNVPSSAQGGPVLIQAGGSEDGRNFAAKHAELVFVMAATAEDIRLYAEDIKARARGFGRDEGAVQVIAAVNVVVAETESIAWRRWDKLTDLVSAELALHMASGSSGIDLSSVDPESRISEYEQERAEEQSGGIAQLFDQMIAANGDMTVRDAAIAITNSAIPTFIGSGEQVTDQLAELYEHSGAAGFMISSPVMPAGFEDFARLVVPKLRERGLFREEYGARTLRERLAE